VDLVVFSYTLAQMHCPTITVLILHFISSSYNISELHSFPTRRSSDLIGRAVSRNAEIMRQMLTQAQTAGQYFTNDQIKEMTRKEIGRAVQQECRDRSRMPSSA